MCGIVGVASTSTIQERGWLLPARDIMRHRGPDDAGEWWSADRRVGLGHRRLAIIDLSSAGHQPMLDSSLKTAIVFNGELYNFRDLRAQLESSGHSFKSDSDTEVLLAAYREWGTDCLGRLNGMFAFAIYDAERQQLFLARDRAGEKPLFYHCDRGVIRFASELKALLADGGIPRKIDPGALDSFLLEGFVAGHRSIIRNVNKLPAAHALTFDLREGALKLWRYWSLPVPSVTTATDAELVDELDGLLSVAVRRQLVADVPVGVLLSGGMDSSLVAAMAARASPRVKAFTVSFPGHGKLDEAHHAKLVADHFGMDHTVLEAEDALVELLPSLATQSDEPLIDSSIIPTFLVSRLVRQHCTVALGGDGGDELFGGYSHYDRLLRLARYTDWAPQPLRSAAGWLAGRVLPVGTPGRNWLQALSVDLRSGVPLIAQYFDAGSRRRMMRPPGWPLVAECFMDQRAVHQGDLIQRATRSDFETYLAEDILAKVDRASMWNSLEVRAPMLDVSLVEFAFGKVPSRLKTTAAGRKILLRKLATRVLPPAFDRERKQGFSIPLSSWLQTPGWLGLFRDVLLDPGQTLFDHGFVEGLFVGQARGRSNGERLFGLVMFELWRRHYGATIGGTTG